MSNESITITQSINSVTVAAGGSVGLNAGGLIQGNLEVDGNVVIDGLLTVGADTDGKDVRFWGETASKYTLWDASQDKLIITGDLQVDGTTTTINSTVVTIEDPVFTLGGATAPTTSDSKDRGIEFHYYDTDASAGKKGFFGWGNSDNAIKFLLNCADPSGSEIFTGDLADIQVGGIEVDGPSWLNIVGPATDTQKSMNVGLRDAAGDLTGLRFNNDGANGYIKFYHNAIERMVVDYDGNVGIGTASPSALLQVGDSATGGNNVLKIAGAKDPGQEVALQFYTGTNSRDWRIKVDASSATFAIRDEQDSLDRLVIDGSGNVGIGTTSPTAKLMVSETSGTIAIFEGSGGTDRYTFGATGASTWRGATGSTMLDMANTGAGDYINVDSGKFLVDTSGNVGIGTASPSTLLHVSGGDITTTGKVVAGDRISTEATTSNALLQVKYNASNYLEAYYDKLNVVGGNFLFQAAGTTRMVIATGGNVGIGTVTPNYLLDVEGGSATARFHDPTATTGATRVLVKAGDADTLGSPAFKVENYLSNHFISMGGDDNGYELNLDNKIKFQGGQMVVESSGFIALTSGDANATRDTSLSRISANVLGVGTGAQGEVDGTLIAGEVRIGNGSVSSPSLKFSNDGDTGIYMGAATSLRLAQGGVDALTIDSSQNVGIGTASPGELLHLQGSASPTLHVESTGDGKGILALDGDRSGADSAVGQIRFQWNNTRVAEIACLSGADTTNKDEGELGFFTAPAGGTIAERVRIDLDGNVGIGTASPSEALHVTGSVRVDTHLSIQPTKKFYLDGGNDTYISEPAANAIGFVTAAGERMRIDAYGQVGLNTATPAHILHIVAGEICVDRTTQDAPFFNYKATADADTTSAISTLTTSGATTHHIQVDINGTKAWIAVSTNNPS